MLIYSRPRFDTNESLVDYLNLERRLSSRALKSVDRKSFVPEREEELCYADTPLEIGFGVTISAPHMHAMCLELLENKLIPGDIQDIGVGSGFLAACMAAMLDLKSSESQSYLFRTTYTRGAKLDPQSFVSGVDRIPGLVELAKRNVKRFNEELLGLPNFKLAVGDGWKGDEPNAPFDAIHVGAAAKGLPIKLLEQLRSGGLMLVPYEMDSGMQYLLVIEKIDERTTAPKFSEQALENFLRTGSDGSKAFFVPDCGNLSFRVESPVAFVPLVKDGGDK